jgi:rhodanese-related sulfurtransferase
MGSGQAAQELIVSPEQVAAMLAHEQPPELVDVREPYEREAGHIDRSHHVQLTELAGEAANLPRDRAIVCYCRVGARSLMAAQALRASGYDAYSMDGGLVRWAAEGRPLVPEDGYVADH